MKLFLDVSDKLILGCLILLRHSLLDTLTDLSEVL